MRRLTLGALAFRARGWGSTVRASKERVPAAAQNAHEHGRAHTGLATHKLCSRNTGVRRHNAVHTGEAGDVRARAHEPQPQHPLQPQWPRSVRPPSARRQQHFLRHTFAGGDRPGCGHACAISPFSASTATRDISGRQRSESDQVIVIRMYVYIRICILQCPACSHVTIRKRIRRKECHRLTAHRGRPATVGRGSQSLSQYSVV